MFSFFFFFQWPTIRVHLLVGVPLLFRFPAETQTFLALMNERDARCHRKVELTYFFVVFFIAEIFFFFFFFLNYSPATDFYEREADLLMARVTAQLSGRCISSPVPSF